MTPRPPHASPLRFLVWAAIALVAASRLIHLDADPAGVVGGEFLTDEGWYALNARNHALFGRWILDQHNVALVLCPLHTFALRTSYALFGVDLWSTRLPGALASALTIGLVALRLRRHPVAAALVAVQPVLYALSRTAFCESLQLLFVAAVWFFASAERPTWRSWSLAGASAALAVLVKASALYAPVLALAAPFVLAGRPVPRRAARAALCVALGGCLVALLFAPFELGYLEVLRTEAAREGSAVAGPPRALAFPLLLGLDWNAGDLRVRPELLAATVVFLFAAGLLLTRQLLAEASFSTLDADRPAARVAAAWFLLSLAVLCTRAHPPLQERYWANLLPPLAILAGLGASPRGAALRTRWTPALGIVSSLALALPAALVVRALATWALEASGAARAYSARTHVALALSALAAVTWVLVRAKVPQRLARSSHDLRPILAGLCVVGALADLAPVALATYTVRDAARDLTRSPVVRVLAGPFANTLSLETPYRAFVVRDLASMGMGTGWINRDWAALGATDWVGDVPPGGTGGREPPPPGAVLTSRTDVWPDAAGHPRTTMFLSALPASSLRPRSTPVRTP